MGKILNYNRRKIAKERFRFFFYEIAIIFLLIFGLLILEWILLPLIIANSTALFGLLLYLIGSLIVISGIVLYPFAQNSQSEFNTLQMIHFHYHFVNAT